MGLFPNIPEGIEKTKAEKIACNNSKKDVEVLMYSKVKIFFFKKLIEI
jgi:hypothetical protein